MTAQRLLCFVLSHFRTVEAPFLAEQYNEISATGPVSRGTIVGTPPKSSGPFGKSGLPTKESTSGPNSRRASGGNKTLANLQRPQSPRLSISGTAKLTVAERDLRRKLEFVEKERSMYFGTALPCIRNNAIKFLLKWLKQYWTDFALDPQLLKRVEDFADSLVDMSNVPEEERDISFYSFGVQLQETIRTQKFAAKSVALSEATKFREARAKINAGKTDAVSASRDVTELLQAARGHYIRNSRLIKHDPQMLAEILTLLEFDQFEKLGIRTVLSLILKGSIDMVETFNHDEHENKTLFQYFKWIATIVNWTTTLIFMADTAIERGSIIDKLVRTAAICRLLNNYSTSASIIAGILREPVLRLTDSLRHVKKKRFVELQELAQLYELDPTVDGNFVKYAQEVSEVQAPFIPIFHYALREFKLNLKQATDRYGTSLEALQSDPMTDPNRIILFGVFADFNNDVNILTQWRKSGYRPSQHSQVPTLLSNHSRKTSFTSMNSVATSVNGGGGDKTPLTRKSVLNQKTLFGTKAAQKKSFYFIDLADVNQLESSGTLLYAKDLFLVASTFNAKEKDLKRCALGFAVITRIEYFVQLAKIVELTEPNGEYKAIPSKPGVPVKSRAANSAGNSASAVGDEKSVVKV